MEIKKHFYNQKFLLGILFLSFIVLRLFSDSGFVLLSSDNFKYLEPARNFPNHTLYNNQLYLLHPPFFPYTIHFLMYLIPSDYFAAVVLSVLSSIVAFYLLYRIFMLITDNNFNMTFLTLFFVTLSVGLVRVASSVLREPYVIMLLLFSLFFYIRAVKNHGNKYYVYSTIFAGLSAITSDYVVLLLPALGFSYFIFKFKDMNLLKFKLPQWKYAILPVIIVLILYGSWLGVRWHQYTDSDFYPNGYSGTPISTEDLGLFQLISPQNFEDYDRALPSFPFEGFVAWVKHFVFNAGYTFNLQPFFVPEGLNFTSMEYLLKPQHIVFMFVIYLPLVLITLYGFFQIGKEFLKTKKIHGNVNLYILGLFLWFAFPITQKYAGPRYIYTSYFFFFYIVALGIVTFFVARKLFTPEQLVRFAAVALVILMPAWIFTHPHFVLTKEPVFYSENTAEYIRENIGTDVGIMSQPGHTITLIYQTENPIVSIFPDPERLDRLVDYYDTEYILFSRYYTWDRYHFSKDTIDYVIDNPDEFELVTTITEDYSHIIEEGNPGRTDEVYIYKILKE